MTRLQGVGIAAALLASIASIAIAVVWDERVPFLRANDGAAWIMPRVRVDSGVRRVRPDSPLAASFETRFERT